MQKLEAHRCECSSLQPSNNESGRQCLLNFFSFSFSFEKQGFPGAFVSFTRRSEAFPTQTLMKSLLRGRALWWEQCEQAPKQCVERRTDRRASRCQGAAVPAPSSPWDAPAVFPIMLRTSDRKTPVLDVFPPPVTLRMYQANVFIYLILSGKLMPALHYEWNSFIVLGQRSILKHVSMHILKSNANIRA